MKNHRSAGLDQLGPRHWINDEGLRLTREMSRPMPRSLNSRAAQSSSQRGVKVTLASFTTLSKLLED